MAKCPNTGSYRHVTGKLLLVGRIEMLRSEQKPPPCRSKTRSDKGEATSFRKEVRAGGQGFISSTAPE